MSKKFKKLNDIILIIIFMFMLILPMIFTSIGKETSDNRVLAQRPHLRVDGKFNGQFFREFDSYINDHFGFREKLINLDINVNLKLFDKPTTGTVMCGKQGWLFYTAENSIGNYQNTNLYTDEELEAMKEKYVNLQKFYNEQGIEFVMMIPPNKNTIYGEYYPEGIKKAGNYSRLDQLKDYFAENTDIPFVDVRDELNAKKDQYELYYKTDTHWNNMGAFIAYQNLIKTIADKGVAVKQFSQDDFNIEKIDKSGGDLLEMLKLDKYKDDAVEYKFKYKNKNGKYGYQSTLIDGKNHFKTESKNKKLGKALIFRDSFGTAIEQFIANSFYEAEFVWDTRCTEYNHLLESKPDVVILEIVERCMW